MKTMCPWCTAVNHLPKGMSCHKPIVVITGRAHCFHDNIYIYIYIYIYMLHIYMYMLYICYIYIYIYKGHIIAWFVNCQLRQLQRYVFYRVIILKWFTFLMLEFIIVFVVFAVFFWKLMRLRIVFFFSENCGLLMSSLLERWSTVPLISSVVVERGLSQHIADASLCLCYLAITFPS